MDSLLSFFSRPPTKPGEAIELVDPHRGFRTPDESPDEPFNRLYFGSLKNLEILKNIVSRCTTSYHHKSTELESKSRRVTQIKTLCNITFVERNLPHLENLSQEIVALINEAEIFHATLTKSATSRVKAIERMDDLAYRRCFK